jgi:hypothetical protein
MKLDTGEQRRIAPEPMRKRKPGQRGSATSSHRRFNRRLIIALAVVIVAGFLLGLGLPIHS